MSDQLQQIRQALSSAAISPALFITHLPHVRWLSGFSGSNGAIYIDAQRAILLTDFRYQEQVKLESPGWETIINRDFSAALATVLPHEQTMAYQSEYVTLQQFDQLKKGLRSRKLISTTGLLNPLAAVKSTDQIKLLQRAQAITDAVFGELLEIIKPGMTEKQLAAEIVYRQLQHGADGMPEHFWPIVASGSRSALPHAEASDKKIERGEVVLMDFGCTVGGYSSDMTRTVACGQPSPKIRQVYEIVLNAQSAALAVAHSGMTGRELDTVARSIINDAGFETAFGHSLGHGVGLEVHEWPAISPRNAMPLPYHAVVTIEPGIYLPGEFGVRIEDMAVLQKNGSRNLTTASKELIIL